MLKKFNIATTTDNDRGFSIQVVDIRGYLDSSTFQELQDHLQDLIDQGEHRIIIDFEQLNYISSAGMGVLMGMLQEVRQNHGDLKLVNMSSKIQNLFDMLGFSRMIRIYNTAEEAKNAFVEEMSAQTEKTPTEENY